MQKVIVASLLPRFLRMYYLDMRQYTLPMNIKSGVLLLIISFPGASVFVTNAQTYKGRKS